MKLFNIAPTVISEKIMEKCLLFFEVMTIFVCEFLSRTTALFVQNKPTLQCSMDLWRSRELQC